MGQQTLQALQGHSVTNKQPNTAQGAFTTVKHHQSFGFEDPIHHKKRLLQGGMSLQSLNLKDSLPIQQLFKGFVNPINSQHGAKFSKIEQRYPNAPSGPPKYRAGWPLKMMTQDVDEAKAIKEKAKEQALKKLEVKREIKKEIDDKIQEKVDSGADLGEIEACIILSDAQGMPIEKCLTADELEEYDNDVDSYVEPGFGFDKEQEADNFIDDTLSDEDKKAISEIEVNKDYESWKQKAEAKEWTILYSKHPEWAIDEDEFDKILINLLESYQEFKQKLNDMKELKKIEKGESSEFKKDIKRKPGAINKFFSNIYSSVSGKGVAIENIRLDVDEFIRYVRIVSSEEIELVHGGDISELKGYLKNLWKTLATEVENVEKEVSETPKELDAESQKIADALNKN